MKYLSCDEAGFISLSCESTRATYETLKRDGYVSYIWRCMLKALVSMVLLAEDDWFYSSHTPSSSPLGRIFGYLSAAWKDRKAAVNVAKSYRMQPINGAYQCLAIDFRLCNFDLRSSALLAVEQMVV